MFQSEQMRETPTWIVFLNEFDNNVTLRHRNCGEMGTFLVYVAVREDGMEERILGIASVWEREKQQRTFKWNGSFLSPFFLLGHNDN